MNFKLIKASLGALALLATPFAAQAADVPIKAPYYKGPQSVISYYNWTGVNRRWIGTPYRHPKGTPLSGGFGR